MKVLVDTSVWADFANGHPSPEALVLQKLIEDEEEIATCGLVAAEFLQGLRRGKHQAEFQARFRDMTWLVAVEPDTWFSAAALFRSLRERGITVRSTVDCVLAVLAQENGCLLLARDRDLSAILASGLVEVAAVPVLRKGKRD
ncbi:MAG: PIN domain nuclease [Deltaproteobacteria bacterium]|nr:PIN domain nuclease [Deltaproteobacteria bacterium]